MTGDISARRGALPIKNQAPPDHIKMVNGFELFKGPPGARLPTLKGTGRSRRLRVDLDFHDPTYPAVTVLPSRHRFPRGTGEAPRRPPVRGFSMGRFSIRNLVQKWAAGRARNARSLPRVESEPVVRTRMAPASALIR